MEICFSLHELQLASAVTEQRLGPRAVIPQRTPLRTHGQKQTDTGRNEAARGNDCPRLGTRVGSPRPSAFASPRTGRGGHAWRVPHRSEPTDWKESERSLPGCREHPGAQGCT